MKTTDKFGLKKPESTDFYNIEDHNYNMDIIEEKLGEHDTHAADKNNPHEVTKETIGLERVPNVTTNEQTPTYATASTAAELSSGEKLSVAFGKIAKAIKDLISHIANNSNPHGVTKAQLGLENVDNKSSATIRGELTSSNVTKALGYTPEKGGTAEIDSAMAHNKDVPSASASYAKIDEIGGMTRKCTNLLDMFSPSGNLDKFSKIDDNTICITANATYATGPIWNFYGKPNTEYVLSFDVDGYENANTFYGGIKNGGVSESLTGVPKTFYTDSNGYSLFHVCANNSRASVDTVVKMTISNMRINEGPTALPYEPYFDGLRSASVIEVESVGANWLDVKAFAKNSISIVEDADGIVTITNNSSNVVSTAISLKGKLPQGTYTIRNNFSKTLFIMQKSGDYSNTVANGGTKTFTYDGTSYLSLLFDDFTANETITGGIMLNKGDEASPYTPHKHNTLPIPEAVQALDGYGLGINESIYNYIDLEKKQFVKRAGCVDMGTLDFKYASSYSYFQCTNAPSDMSFKGYDYHTISNMLCAEYPTHAWADITSEADDFIAMQSSYFAIKDKTYTDAETFKSAMSGVMLYYELATPIITDISDILPDNIIGVEGGGTITFVNEFGYDVPNEVVFYLNGNDIICAKEFVGDLIGTAAKAKYAENVAVATKAIQDNEGNEIAATYETKAASEAKFNEVKKSVADGKSLLADTISAYGIDTASDASFEVINNNISAVYSAGVASASSEGYTSGYNKGVEDADARVNTESASYITGYANGQEDGSELDGTAVSSMVLDNATFYNTSTKKKETGTMPNYSSNVQTVTPSASQNKTAEFDIPDGYHTKIKVNSYNVYNAGYNAGYNDGGIAAKETYYDYLEVTASCQVTLSSSVGTAKYVITDYINQGYEFVGFKKVYNTSGEAFVSGQMLYMDSATGAQEARCTIRATSTSSGTKSFDAVIVLKKHPM